MSKYDRLFGVLEQLKNDDFGEVIVDKEHKGTPEDPMHFPYVVYTKTVREFIEAIYEFVDNNPDYDLKNYEKLLNDRGIDNMDEADIDSLDEQGTLALLVCAVRGERFCDGLILSNMENGRIPALIEHLKDIPE